MWYNGYLEQARSDWKAYNILQVAPISNCHALHYLQMTTEKLGKALLLAYGTAKLPIFKRIHLYFKNQPDDTPYPTDNEVAED